MENKKETTGSHTLRLEDRNRLTVTDVRDVESFHEEGVFVDLSFGGLVIKGQGLHLEKLDPETSSAIILGQISSMSYSEKKGKPQGGLLKKVFK